MTAILDRKIAFPKDLRVVDERGYATPAFHHLLANLAKTVGVIGEQEIPDVKGLAFLDTLPVHLVEAGLYVRVDDGASRTEKTDWSGYIVEIPSDDTRPQIGEGLEVFTLDYTPRYAGSVIVVDVTLHVGSSSGACPWAAALFRAGASLDAVETMSGRLDSATVPMTARMRATIPSWGSVPDTLSVRIGRIGGSGGYPQVNASAGSRSFGGSLVSVMRIEEWIGTPVPAPES